MHLEYHDDKVNDPIGPKMRTPTHCGTKRNIDYDYQAEMLLLEAREDMPQSIRWVLFDDRGARAVWELRGGQPTLIACAARFTGEGFRWLDKVAPLPEGAQP